MKPAPQHVEIEAFLLHAGRGGGDDVKIVQATGFGDGNAQCFPYVPLAGFGDFELGDEFAGGVVSAKFQQAPVSSAGGDFHINVSDAVEVHIFENKMAADGELGADAA